MEKYGTITRLMENQLYTVTLRLRGEPTTISFTSRYAPLFSTTKLVRSEFRNLFSRYTDDEINQIIHENSKLALELANPAIDAEGEIPYYARQYVRYKTAYDLMTDIVFTTSANAGSQEKLLGDMKIAKEIRTRDLDKVLDRLERKLAPWEAELTGMRARPRGAVRGVNSENGPYPIDGRIF